MDWWFCESRNLSQSCVKLLNVYTWIHVVERVLIFYEILKAFYYPKILRNTLLKCLFNRFWLLTILYHLLFRFSHRKKGKMKVQYFIIALLKIVDTIFYINTIFKLYNHVIIMLQFFL